MKIIGTGEPRVMTVRLEPCEIALWREQVRRLLATVQSGREAGYSSRGAWFSIESPEEQLRIDHLELARLAQELDAAEADSLESPRVAAPTDLVDAVVRSVARRAADRLADALDRYNNDGGHDPSTLATPAATLTACLETMRALEWVDGHGVAYYFDGFEDPDSLRDAGVPEHTANGRARAGPGALAARVRGALRGAKFAFSRPGNASG